MASYFIDTEFLEGTQKRRILGIELPKYFDTKPVIDLISIGLVSEATSTGIGVNSGEWVNTDNSREYYAISKDFNLEEAWNRYDLVVNKHYPAGSEYNKVYWIRKNVLKPIWEELCSKSIQDYKKKGFTYNNLKKLISKYGKTNKQIAEEIKEFVYNPTSVKPLGTEESIKFYGYYADYDWVVFAWLFGKMIDLPKGFPYYCRDLKQLADSIYESTGKDTKFESPKGEHNALADAKWNYEFYKFLKQV